MEKGKGKVKGRRGRERQGLGCMDGVGVSELPLGETPEVTLPALEAALWVLLHVCHGML